VSPISPKESWFHFLFYLLLKIKEKIKNKKGITCQEEVIRSWILQNREEYQRDPWTSKEGRAGLKQLFLENLLIHHIL